MAKFHNTYQFIRASGKINGTSTPTTSYADIQNGRTHARHDVWRNDTYSGRVICSLKLKTRTVVGAEQTDAKPAVVKPYCRNGKPAIPANSLRGMVGSIAETLSQSALRVLDNRPYSVRKSMEEGLSALGFLRSAPKGSGRRFDLIPLTLPTLKAIDSNNYEVEEKWQLTFNEGLLLMKRCLSVYVDGYDTAMRDGRAVIRIRQGSFLEQHNPLSFNPKNNPQYYYARFASGPNSDARLSDPIRPATSHYYEKSRNTRNGNIHFLLGQQLADASNDLPNLINQEQWQAMPIDHKQQYNKGFLRVLGINGRENDIPTTKHHEIFIPVPEKGRNIIPVPNNVIERFVTLAEERNDSDSALPFNLQGSEGWQPKPNDIVFFDVELINGNVQVSEISISSIWRKLIPHTPHEYFESIQPNLTPFNPKRNELTPAELLFGVVDEEKPESDSQGRALASRLRFADALPRAEHDITLDEQTTLKILASPKPPSPAMYFHRKNQQNNHYISKAELAQQDHKNIQPNGRKMYLHHRPQEVEQALWKTQADNDRLEQKLSCTPMLPDSDSSQPDFYFHIDFDNLTQAELGLLLRSLQPDIEGGHFQHRLGLGKALGLGSVGVDIVATLFIDRQARYGRDALKTQRYSQFWTHSDDLDTHQGWSKRYANEYSALQAHQAGTAIMEVLPIEKIFNNELVDADTLECLKLVGDPSKLTESVQPPLTTQQALGAQSAEEETFQWFVSNDDKNNNNRQALGYIQNGNKLPTLDKLKKT